MAYPIFQLPDSWIGWLSFAIKAEQMAVEQGMNSWQACQFLSKQSPEKVVEFVNRYYSESNKKTERIYDYTFHYSSTHVSLDGNGRIPRQGTS